MPLIEHIQPTIVTRPHYHTPNSVSEALALTLRPEDAPSKGERKEQRCPEGEVDDPDVVVVCKACGVEGSKEILSDGTCDTCGQKWDPITLAASNLLPVEEEKLKQEAKAEDEVGEDYQADLEEIEEDLSDALARLESWIDIATRLLANHACKQKMGTKLEIDLREEGMVTRELLDEYSFRE